MSEGTTNKPAPELKAAREAWWSSISKQGDPLRRVSRKGIEGPVQLEMHGAVERVAHLGPVERDRRHAPGPLHDDRAIVAVHSLFPKCRPARPS